MSEVPLYMGISLMRKRRLDLGDGLLARLAWLAGEY